jgi:DNA invertase Pin-like site-specific DNA recombinase
MALLGYARVSRPDQDPQRQIDELQAAGCERVWTDHGVSGTKASRPEWDQMLAYARSGDTICVTELSRAGRNVRNLLTLCLDDLAGRGIGLRSLSQGIDTSESAGPMGRLMLTLLAALAELEREILVERTKSGLAAARARGRVGGRPPVMTPERIDAARAMLDAGTSVSQAARTLGVSRTTVYAAIDPRRAPTSVR